MRLRTRAGAGLAGVLFLVPGLLGAFRYADSFWLYRGFPPPTLSGALREVGRPSVAGSSTAVKIPRGELVRIMVTSPAVAGRSLPVWVYLPPGYARSPARRYPVLYLLHGFPGSPLAYITVGRLNLIEDVLVAQHRMRPLILVMPLGSTHLFHDDEWANGVRRGSQWETYLARDVVGAVDARFRTIDAGRGRGIAGLSEGGYGAVNIALHHPGEFDLVESWSGYMLADHLPSVFDHSASLLRDNSPLFAIRGVAPILRAVHAYFWLYSGVDDRVLYQNELFARELAAFGVAHRFFVTHGGHTWLLWRQLAPEALLVASRHLALR